MGNLISQIRLAFRDFQDILNSYRALSNRLKLSPGLPVPNPTTSFWTVPPSVIAKHISELPVYADVVIIGSGISGTSVARKLLSDESKSLGVVMLEARDICSGATGRNGGHTNPILYPEYGALKQKHGIEMAQKIIRFRQMHFSAMRRVCEEEGLLEATQCRQTEHVDVFYDGEMFESQKRKFEEFRNDMPQEAAQYTVYESKDAIEKFHLADDVAGCIATTGGGAMHPYRLVTGVLSNLLERHPKKFHLLSNTPCTSIHSPTSNKPLYTLTTPRGTITTPHIIHATNAHLSHLLPQFRSKVVPSRGTMTAQRPGELLTPSTLDGYRSLVFYRDELGYDYLTQLPEGECELMLGGGVAAAGDELLLKEIGIVDDSEYCKQLVTHLSGSLPIYFGHRNWGAESVPDEDFEGEEWHQGRVKSIWSGIISISADALPWVGRLSTKLSGRKSPPASSTPQSQTRLTCTPSASSKEALLLPTSSMDLTAPPGEWVTSSYTGEGMVHAWLCATALGSMILGTEIKDGIMHWFPEVMEVSEERWKKAKIGDLMGALNKD